MGKAARRSADEPFGGEGVHAAVAVVLVVVAFVPEPADASGFGVRGGHSLTSMTSEEVELPALGVDDFRQTGQIELLCRGIDARPDPELVAQADAGLGSLPVLDRALDAASASSIRSSARTSITTPVPSVRRAK